MNDFVSLTKALEMYFDKPLNELPNALRERVLRDFSEAPRSSSPQAIWDELPPEQRRYRAEEWDCHNDPAMAEDLEYWKAKRENKLSIEKQIEQWEAVTSPTALDLDRKEKRIQELREQLAPMQKEQDRGDYPAFDTDKQKHPGHLDHDLDWQARANQIAKKQMASKKRSVTKNEVAHILAEELKEDEGTVLRRIRKEWKFKRQPNCL